MKTFTLDVGQTFIDFMGMSARGYRHLRDIPAGAGHQRVPDPACQSAMNSVMALLEVAKDGRYFSVALANQIDKRDRDAAFNTERAQKAAAVRHGKEKPPAAPVAQAGRTDPPDEQEHKPTSLGSLLPLGFSLSGTNITTAKAVGVDMDTLATLFDEFKNFHINAGTLHPDWHAAWDKWFRAQAPEEAAWRAARADQPGPAPEATPTEAYEPDMPDDD